MFCRKSAERVDILFCCVDMFVACIDKMIVKSLEKTYGTIEVIIHIGRRS